MARNWNPEAAEKMFRDSLKWREQWKVDQIEDWLPPEPFLLYYPSGVSGFDKEGSPIIIVPFAGLDMWGMIHSATRSDFVRYTLRTLERYLKLANEQSDKHGINARKLVAVIDMEGFNMRQYIWKPAGELVVALLKMYEANYPEILKACYILNANRLFTIAFSLVRKFLNEDTINKIHVLKGDKKKFIQQLLNVLDASQLPKYLGGTQVDENGDEKCSAKIAQGGKIPKSYYYRKPDKSSNNNQEKEFTIVEVKKSSKITLDFEATTPSSILKYEFRTEGPDVRFGVVRHDKSGNVVEEIALHKVQSSKNNELGVLTHDDATTYKVTFDNTGTMLRGVKVHYNIQVLPPLGTE